MEFRDLIYTSPSGQNFNLPYDGGINDSIDHELGVFNFATVDGEYHQDQKIKTGSYAFNLVLSDIEQVRLVRSICFEKKTKDSVGQLQHPDPSLGSFPAVILSASFSSNAVNDINTTRVNIVFKRDIADLEKIDPNQVGLIDDINATIDELNVSQQEQFSTSLRGESFSEVANSVVNAIGLMDDTIKVLSKTLTEIESEFNLLTADILNNLDTLVYTPLLLAEKIQNLVQLPMVVNDSINNRLNYYESFYNSLFNLSSSELLGIESGDVLTINNIATRAVFMLSTVSALNYIATTGQSFSVDELKDNTKEFDFDSYYSRKKVTEVIQSNYDLTMKSIEFLSFVSSQFNTFSFFNQYIDYSVLIKKIVDYTNSVLNSKLLQLPAEKEFVLDKSENLIKVCYRSYNDLSNNVINFFIKSNSIIGDEIKMLPINRVIKVY